MEGTIYVEVPTMMIAWMRCLNWKLEERENERDHFVWDHV